jgi:hypothetical protein
VATFLLIDLRKRRKVLIERITADLGPVFVGWLGESAGSEKDSQVKDYPSVRNDWSAHRLPPSASAFSKKSTRAVMSVSLD